MKPIESLIWKRIMSVADCIATATTRITFDSSSSDGNTPVNLRCFFSKLDA
jgi:hypothetical protein